MKVRQIWIVNVGDIKPMEFPISFFLDYAWNPEKIGADDLQKYTEQWALHNLEINMQKKLLISFQNTPNIMAEENLNC